MDKEIVVKSSANDERPTSAVGERQTMALSEQTVKEATTNRLIEAITKDHFVLYGQPIVPIGPAQEPSGYIEVLVRYVEEERKLLPPGGFFEVLESLKLMAVLDRWVLNRVVHSLAGQHAAQKNWNLPRYSVNLSVDSLYEHEFCGLVLAYFRKNSLPAGQLWFEITESDAQAHAIALEKLTANLKPAGCGFTLSSYTGVFLSPASLQELGVGSVKIDGQIVGYINHAAAFARAKTIHLECKDLGIRTIAEMVEYPEALEELKKIGFDYAQGFAIAPPAPLQSLRNTWH